MNIVRDLQTFKRLRENLGLVSVLLVAGLLRFLFLNIKAPHFDEGVYGFFVQEIWRRGFFPYDPTNFHGPVYYYALQWSEQIFGRGVFAFRFISGVFSILSVYYTWRLNKFFGEVAIWAALALAVSPAAVFYSRYAMHESMFVLFQILFAYHFFDFLEMPNKNSAWKLGLYAALMFATKETTVIFLFCFLGASFLVKLLNETKQDRSEFIHKIGQDLLGPQNANLRYFWIALISLVIFICFIFSGLGTDAHRILDFFKAYFFWTKTGTQHISGHEKPFIYWFELLVRYEWPAFVGLLLSPLLIFLGSKPARFFGIFALGNLIAYAIIPYKTPWCILGIAWPFYFLIGFAMSEMQSFKFVQAISISKVKMDADGHYRSKRGSALLALLICIVSLGMAIRLNFFHYHDSSEPYVYVQSSGDINSISEILNHRVESFPEDFNMSILIGLKATWPFPWLLTNFTHITYREIFGDSSEAAKQAGLEEQQKSIRNSDVILVDLVDESKIEKQLTRKYYKSQFKVRDSYNLCTLFLNADKFQISDLSFAQARTTGGELSGMNFTLVEAKDHLTQ